MLDLEPIKKRISGNNELPWEVYAPEGRPLYVRNNCEVLVCGVYPGHNIELIANAPTDLAALVKEVERLRFEAEMYRVQMLPFLEQVESLKRRHEVDQKQLLVFSKALEWYAEPANWVEQVDNRGRETIRWKWAADDGNMARHALAVWRESRKSV